MHKVLHKVKKIKLFKLLDNLQKVTDIWPKSIYVIVKH